MPLDAITRTAQNVYDYVTRIFGDEAGVQVTTNDIFTWINMGQREIIISNPVVRSTGTINLTLNTAKYDPSSLDILKIQSVWGPNGPLEYKPFQEAEAYIVSQDPSFVVRGTPTIWYDWAGDIYVYPVPDKTYTAGLTIYFLKDITPVTALSDFLTVPDTMFNRLCEYVMAQAYELDEDSQNSQFKLGQFRQGLDMQAERETQGAEQTYKTITILPDDDWY